MVFSDYTKQRILFFHEQGYRPPRISDLLLQEGISARRSGIARLIKRYEETDRRSGSSRPTKITDEMKFIVDGQMEKDDETTVQELHATLYDGGYSVSKSTVLWCRKALGWTFRASAYCQMIRDANKVKRLEWARAYTSEADTGFLDVIWTDETSIQLESHRRFCCRKVGEPPRPKPRYSGMT